MNISCLKARQTATKCSRTCIQTFKTRSKTSSSTSNSRWMILRVRRTTFRKRPWTRWTRKYTRFRRNTMSSARRCRRSSSCNSSRPTRSLRTSNYSWNRRYPRESCRPQSSRSSRKTASSSRKSSSRLWKKTWLLFRARRTLNRSS